MLTTLCCMHCPKYPIYGKQDQYKPYCCIEFPCSPACNNILSSDEATRVTVQVPFTKIFMVTDSRWHEQLEKIWIHGMWSPGHRCVDETPHPNFPSSSCICWIRQMQLSPENFSPGRCSILGGYMMDGDIIQHRVKLVRELNHSETLRGICSVSDCHFSPAGAGICFLCASE